MLIDTVCGQARMRIWTPPDSPIDGGEPYTDFDVCVEWRGVQAGHPSSYGLLGGTLNAVTRTVTLPAGPFEAASAGVADVVSFGLTGSLARRAIATAAPDLTVTIAAEGRSGSSAAVFYMLAATSASLIRDGIPNAEGAIWEAQRVAAERMRAWVDAEHVRRQAR